MSDQTPEPRYVLDRDGDLWQSLGHDWWRCLTTESTDQLGGDLVSVCGPLREMVARAEAAADALRSAADDLYSDNGPGNMLSTATWLRARAVGLSSASQPEAACTRVDHGTRCDMRANHRGCHKAGTLWWHAEPEPKEGK